MATLVSIMQPVPKKPLESVLSSYLNTHLPLPCQLNSLHSIKEKKHLPHPLSGSAPSSPTKKSAPKNPNNSSMLSRQHGSSYSLASSGSGASTHTSLASVNHTDHFKHSSAALTNSVEPRPSNQLAMEAAYDVASASGGGVYQPDGTESVVSLHSSLLAFNNGEDEEGHTIGVSTSLLSTHSLSQSRRPSIPQSHTSTPTCPDFPLPQTRAQADQEGVGIQQQQQQQQQYQHQQSSDSNILQSLLYKFIVCAHRFISWLILIIQKGLEPHIQHKLRAMVKAERKHSPLSNALLSLGSEASSRHCPHLWACAQNTQLALLVLAGGGMERFLWRELKLVVCDEVNWTRALYSLRHTLWPGGHFIKSPRRKLNEAELEQLKRKAADAFKKFLPSKY